MHSLLWSAQGYLYLKWRSLQEALGIQKGEGGHPVERIQGGKAGTSPRAPAAHEFQPLPPGPVVSFSPQSGTADALSLSVQVLLCVSLFYVTFLS